MHRNLDKMLENCRLCQQIPGCTQITENNNFIEQVFECTKVKINDDQMHMLPKTVCRFCKVRIERFYTFIQEVRAIDEKLQEQFRKNTKARSDELFKEDMEIERENIYFKCPAYPKTFARYQQIHVNLYCSICKETLSDISLYNSHICDTVNVENIKEPEPSKNQAESELTLSDIIGSSDLEEECLEVEIIPEDEEQNDEIEDKCIPDAIENDTISDEKSEPSSETEAEPELVRKSKDDTISDEKSEPSSETEAEPELVRKSKGYYSCNLCDKKYLCNSHLRTHQKIHGNSFPCPFQNCRKVCTSAYSLETHTLRHNGKLPFLCSTCGKGLTTKSSLKCHEKIHAKVKEYVCKECNIRFSIRNTLRAHQKKEHEGVRFYCSQCPGSFTARGSLERHELVHKGVKDFECETCRAKFYTNKELVNHQRYHKDLRLYKCDLCYKTFFEKHHLTIHLRLHSGERPYVCKIKGCGKAFVDSQGLSQHRKSRHV